MTDHASVGNMWWLAKLKFVHFIKRVISNFPPPSPPVTQVGGGGGPRCAARVEGSWGDALVAVAVESTTAMLVWWSVEDGHVIFFCVWQRRKPIYSCDRVKKSG